MQTEDGYFIQKCLNGESEAFGFLVDKYKASVYYFLLARLRNVHDAEDVSQKVFLRAYERLAHLRRWESFARWLYSIAYTQSRNFIRERQNRPDREYFEEQDPSIMINHSMDSYHEEQATESLRETVEEALNSLPEMYREVLVLHYIGGMQNKEIAVILGTSIDNIKQRLSRARSMLKDEILAMMSSAYDQQQKLTARFTFHIMEMIKKLKIHPVSTTKGLPWGLSLAAGLIIAVMSINPALIQFTHIGTPIYAPLPSETKVLKIGEIPVDVVKTSNIPFLSGNMGKGNGGEQKPDMQNSFFLAPKGEGGTWAKKADMPTPRGYMGTCVVNNIIYTTGGLLGEYRASSKVEAYDPKTDTWTKKADMPIVIGSGTACAVDGIIYTFGGWDLNQLEQSAVFAYNPKTDMWTRKADMPTARWVGAACVVDNIIYVIDGVIKAGFTPLSVVEAYDPKTDTWTKKADTPMPLGCAAACAVDGIIYAFNGGWNGASEQQLQFVFAYNPKTDTWTRKADTPMPIAWTTACAVNGTIYAIGGWHNNRDNTVEAYDPATDTWTKKSDMSTGRMSPGACVVNGKMYAIGGIGVAAVEEYDTEYDTVSAVSSEGKLATTWANNKIHD